MSQHQQILLQALALLIDHLGQNVPHGKELYFSDKLIANLTPDAQLQAERHPTKPGFCVRYLPNRTINGKSTMVAEVVDDDSSRLLQHPQADDPTPA